MMGRFYKIFKVKATRGGLDFISDKVMRWSRQEWGKKDEGKPAKRL